MAERRDKLTHEIVMATEEEKAECDARIERRHQFRLKRLALMDAHRNRLTRDMRLAVMYAEDLRKSARGSCTPSSGLMLSVAALLERFGLPAETSAPQEIPCSCTTYCMHSGYPDAPIKRGVYCKEGQASVEPPATPYICPECKIEAGFHELTCSRWRAPSENRPAGTK